MAAVGVFAPFDVAGEGGCYDAGTASDSSMWEVVTGGVSNPAAAARMKAMNASAAAVAAEKEERADSHLNAEAFSTFDSGEN